MKWKFKSTYCFASLIVSLTHNTFAATKTVYWDNTRISSLWFNVDASACGEDSGSFTFGQEDRTYPAPNRLRRAITFLDLSGIPSGSTVNSAVMSYGFSANASDVVGKVVGGFFHSVHLSADGFNWPNASALEKWNSPVAIAVSETYSLGNWPNYPNDVTLSSSVRSRLAAALGTKNCAIIFKWHSQDEQYVFDNDIKNVDGASSDSVLIQPSNFSILIDYTPPKVAPPTCSLESGEYLSGVNYMVTLACATSGSTIRYTTNGTEPTTTSSQYTGVSITIAGTAGSSKTLKIKAFKTDWTASDTTTNNYTFKDNTIYFVTYDKNGIDVLGKVPSSQSGKAGTVITLASRGDLYNYDGYSFAGWDTKADGTGTSYNEGDQYTISGNVTMFVKWSANPINGITFYGNYGSSGGGSGPDNMSGRAGTSLTIPGPNTLYKTGFTFSGWNTKADGTGTTYLEGDKYLIPWTGWIGLYAIWTTTPPPTTYTLDVQSSNPVSGVIITSSTEHGGTTPYSKTSQPSGTSINLTAPQYYGSGSGRKRFNGWSGGLTSPNLTASFSISGNTTITANYVDDPDTLVVIVLQNAVAVTGIAGAQDSTDKQYKITVPSGATSLTIQISGGTGDCDLYVKYGAMPTTSSYDYRSYLSGNEETVAVSSPTVGAWYIMLHGFDAYSGVTLTATYTTIPSVSYTISTLSSPPMGGMTDGDDLYLNGGQCTVTATPNSGYTFSSWTDDSTVVSTSASYTFTVTGNRTLTANFTAISPTYYTIATSSSPTVGGTTDGSGLYQSGDQCTVTAMANSGYAFINWTEDGSEVSTLPSYTFPVTGDRMLTANFAVISPGDPVLEAVGVYDGYLYGFKLFGENEMPTCEGTLNVRVARLDGRLTVKAILKTGSIGFSGKLWTAVREDGTKLALLSSRNGETLELEVRQNYIWGTLSGGKLGDEILYIDGCRNWFSDLKNVQAQQNLNQYIGYYTALLCGTCRPNNFIQGELNVAPQGYGYLTLVVGARGRVRIAGVLADGTRVSQSAPLLQFYSGERVYVPFFIPLYSKQGWIGGLFELDPSTRQLNCYESVMWDKPGLGPDGFTGVIDVWGGGYNPVPSLTTQYSLLSWLDVGLATYYHSGGLEWPVLGHEAALPVTVSGTQMILPEGTRPIKVVSEGGMGYEYGGDNPSMFTFSFAPMTGIFRGKYRVYYDFIDINGRYQHKTVTVPYAGIMITNPETGVLTEGAGHALFPSNDPELKAYRIKRSFPVFIWDATNP